MNIKVFIVYFFLSKPSFFPQECAESLRQTLRSGVMNVKDRLSIKMDNDMRKGLVQFDSWVMSAKVHFNFILLKANIYVNHLLFRF